MDLMPMPFLQFLRKIRDNRASFITVVFVAVIFVIAFLYTSFNNVSQGDLESFVLCPKTVIPGSDFKVRFLARKHSNNEPLPDTFVLVKMYGRSGRLIASTTQKTGPKGAALFNIPIPGDLHDKEVSLRISSSSSVGKAKFKARFSVETEEQIRLVCDKKEYFSDDIISVQIFVGRNSDGLPTADKELKISLYNDTGICVYASDRTTNDFGIYHEKISLGTLIKPGIYTLRVQVGDAFALQPIQISKVSKPALNLSVKAEPGYFLSGERTQITVFAEDRNGVAAIDAEITATCTEEVDEVSGREKKFKGYTDTNGKFSFFHKQSDYKDNFLSDKNAQMRIQVAAQNRSGDTTNIVRTYPLIDRPLYISCFPENQGLVPGIRNRLFVASWYPDGRPAGVKFFVKLKEGIVAAKNVAEGVGVIDFDPAEQLGFLPTVTAITTSGQKVEYVFDPTPFLVSHQIYFSTDSVLFNSGDMVDVRLKGPSGEVFLDLICNNKVIGSVRANLTGKESQERLKIPDNVWGLCFVTMSYLDGEGNLQQTSQPIYVGDYRRNQLRVSSNKEVYYPKESGAFRAKLENGSEGTVSFYLSKKQDFNSFTPAEISKTGNIPYSVMANLIQNLILDPSEKDLQHQMRLLLKGIQGNVSPFYFENIYRNELQNSENRKVLFSHLIFSYSGIVFSFISLLLCILTLGLTVYRNFRRITAHHPLLNLPARQDVLQLIMLCLGLFLTVLVPLALFLILIGLSRKSFTVFLVSKDILPVAVSVLICNFIYLLFLNGVIKTEFFLQASRLFRLNLKLLFFYCISILFLASLFLIASQNWMGRWNYETLLATHCVFMELVLFSQFIMPFIFIYNILSDLFLSENRNYNILSFSLTVVLVLLILSSCGLAALKDSFGIAQTVRDYVARKRTVGEIKKDQVSAAELSFDNINDLLRLRISKNLLETSLVTDASGNGSVGFFAPQTTGSLLLRGEAFTTQGNFFMAFSEMRVERPCSVFMSVPNNLDKGDSIKFPVYLRNYKDVPLQVTLRPSYGSKIVMKDKIQKRYLLQPQHSHTFYFTIEAIEVGEETLGFDIEAGEYQESVSQNIAISPPGIPVYRNVSGYLGSQTQQNFTVQKENGVFLNANIYVYPGIFSLLAENQKIVNHTPEHHSLYYISCLNLNTLLCNYMVINNRTSLPLYRNTLQEINKDYQNLLSFENNGFCLFENSPVSLWVTADALQALSVASKSAFIDARVMEDTARVLLSAQKKNGSWENNLRITAKVVRSLQKAGFGREQEIKKAEKYIQQSLGEQKDPYTLALCALVLLENHKNLQDVLVGVIKRNQNQNGSWSTSEGVFGSLPGIDSDLETTALCLKVMSLSSSEKEVCDQAVQYLLSNMDPNGTWYSSGATYAVLDGLTTYLSMNDESPVLFESSLILNGQEIYGSELDSSSIQCVKIPVKSFERDKMNTLSIHSSSPLFACYRMSLTGFQENDDAVQKPLEGLNVKATFSRSQTVYGGVLVQHLTVNNASRNDLNNLVLEIPIPPGFSFIEKSLVQNKEILSYTVTSNKVLIYLNMIEEGSKFNKSISFRANQRGVITVSPVSLYQFTDPWHRTYAKPEILKIR